MFFKKISFFLLLFVVFGHGMAQDYDSFFYGKLMDATTGEPVVFATVRVKGKALGVISNNDGGFKIPTAFQLKGDALVISSMGYETKEVDFAILKETGINRISIKPYTFELMETVVTAKKRKRLIKTGINKNLTAKQIVRNALERIPNNYDKNPYELIGYYRDYQMQEQKYMNLNEGLIKVFDKGFDMDGYKSLQFGLYNYKPNLDFELDSFAAKPYNYNLRDKYIPNTEFSNSVVPNELTLLFNHDAIRHNNELSYSFVDIFIKDFIKKHDFYTYFLTNYGDKKVYKIKFAKRLNRFQAKGDIYIDTDTYAIRKLDYVVYRHKLEEPSPAEFSASEMDLLYEILVEYAEHGGYMYLNYISFHNRFKLVRPPKFYVKEIIQRWDIQELHLSLNKPAKNWSSLKPKDLNIYYGSDRLNVDRLSQIDMTTYKFEFSRDSKSKRKKIREFFREIGSKKQEPVIVEVNDLKDMEGNLLDEENSELLDQFREFFTQKVITKATNKTDSSLIVDKETSLGHPDQPRIKAEMNEDFWMNTPLKSNL